MKTVKEHHILENEQSSLTIHQKGGAIIDFHLKDNGVNPLCFEFSKDQMPENNKGGAPYRGHFLCLGRWGLPSSGEIKAGIPNHGQIANVAWKIDGRSNQKCLMMEAIAPKEGLKLERKIRLDPKIALIEVSECVTNQNPLGRVFNMVQHPTLAKPFLAVDTLIDCNGDIGFDQDFPGTPDSDSFTWPYVKLGNDGDENLRNPKIPRNAVYTIIVRKTDELGWITAFSPSLKTMIAYIWKRSDYPWIHHWLHYEGSKLEYRGMEFGTAGIHQPFKTILMEFPKVFDHHTFDYIDSGEKKVKKYLSFLIQIDSEFQGVDHIGLDHEIIFIKEKHKDNHIIIPLGFKVFT
ncbi:hypothetical protein [Pararhodonellum marinum]|uniref:hypothetical protein n=1 Tax=Pararhodonellum marinum TaxID=2755358 RepID=UPI00188EF8F4|nr:hypothetical protein [Pararhodonellum marinum]